MFDWMWIPFAAGALVLLWALASFAMAASGSERAGLHAYVDGRDRAEAARELRQERTFGVYRALNYLLALAVIAATFALFGATLFIE